MTSSIAATEWLCASMRMLAMEGFCGPIHIGVPDALYKCLLEGHGSTVYFYSRRHYKVMSGDVEVHVHNELARV